MNIISFLKSSNTGESTLFNLSYNLQKIDMRFRKMRRNCFVVNFLSHSLSLSLSRSFSLFLSLSPSFSLLSLSVRTNRDKFLKPIFKIFSNRYQF